jgi:uncharacterized protein YcfJ
MTLKIANNPEIESLYDMEPEQIAIAANASVKAVLNYLCLDKNLINERDTNPDYQKIVSAHLILATLKQPRKKIRYKVTPNSQ